MLYIWWHSGSLFTCCYIWLYSLFHFTTVEIWQLMSFSVSHLINPPIHHSMFSFLKQENTNKWARIFSRNLTYLVLDFIYKDKDMHLNWKDFKHYLTCCTYLPCVTQTTLIHSPVPFIPFLNVTILWGQEYLNINSTRLSSPYEQ